MRAISRIKSRVAGHLETVAEVAGLVISASGATLAAVLGKLVIGVFLSAVALGFLLRLKGRKPQAAAASPPSLPNWVRFAVVVASLVEAAVLVEATNLPVRFDQAGFQYAHWFLVALVFLAAYFLQTQALVSAMSRRAGRRVA